MNDHVAGEQDTGVNGARSEEIADGVMRVAARTIAGGVARASKTRGWKGQVTIMKEE